MKNIIKIELIENYIHTHNLTKKIFCVQCKIRIEELEKILTNNLDINILSLFKVAKILNIQLYELFNK